MTIPRRTTAVAEGVKRYLNKHPEEKEKARLKKSEENKAYYEKTKKTSEKKSNLQIAAVKREAKKRDRQRKHQESLMKKIESDKRKKEVARVQIWRMRIKLKEKNPSIQRHNNQDTSTAIDYNRTSQQNDIVTNTATEEIEKNDDDMNTTIDESSTSEQNCYNEETNITTDPTTSTTEEQNNNDISTTRQHNIARDPTTGNMPQQNAKDNTTREHIFSSSSTAKRAVKRAKDSLPATPRRKAVIIQKLAESPSCREILEKKGAVLTDRAKNKLEMGEALMQTFSSSISNIRPTGKQGKGTIRKENKAAFTYVKSTLSGVKNSKVRKTLFKELKLKKTKGNANAQRKRRKDAISDQKATLPGTRNKLHLGK